MRGQLSDFGCARLLREEEVEAGGARQHRPTGTPAYMAPGKLGLERHGLGRGRSNWVGGDGLERLVKATENRKHIR